MSAVWYRFRAELRTRWRAWLGLALLAGVVAGAVIALIAGARRTDSAYARFVRAQNGYDALVVNYPDAGAATFDFDELARLPMVADSARGEFNYSSLDVPYVAPVDNRFGTAINRFKILDGRAPQPDHPEEVAVPFLVAEQLNLRVGSRFDLIDPSQLTEAPPGFEAQVERLRALLAQLPHGKFEVVGIEASPGEFPPLSRSSAPFHLTPAFDRLSGPNTDGEALAVRFRNGSSDYAAFARALHRRSGGLAPEVFNAADQAANVERSIHVQVVGLWILAGLVALTGCLVIGQLLGRLSAIEATGNATLAALGTTRGQRTMVGLGRASLVGGVAAVVGLVVAMAVSPLLPTGLARTAEPDPGVHVDGLVLGLGFLATVLLIVVLSAWPTWLAASRISDEGGRAIRPSLVGRALARGMLSPAPAAGVRMAVEPGRGRTAVPVRSSTAAVVVGVVALVGAVTFGASLDYLLDTPRAYGITWDLTLTNFGFGAPIATVGAEAARDTSGVRAFAVGDMGSPVPLLVGDLAVDMLALRQAKGRVEPHIIEGRAPRASDEILLGTKTFDELGAAVGKKVAVGLQGQARREFTIVGRAIVPTGSDAARSGTGAVVSLAGERWLVRRIQAEADADADENGIARKSVTGNTMFVDLEPGANPGTVIAAVNEGIAAICDREPTRCPTEEGAGRVGPQESVQPVDVVDFGRVRNLPLVLGGVLAVLAAGTLAHVLVSAIRRRNRDLAMLKTLGFTRRQVSIAVTMQAMTTTAIALVIGVPLGIVVGRWLWSARADALGVLNVPRVPWTALAIIVPAALLLAVLIAALPARAAARTHPAFVLRSE